MVFSIQQTSNTSRTFQNLHSSNPNFFLKSEFGLPIDNNTELAAAASYGNGTHANPYIIENLSVALGLFCPLGVCYPSIGISIQNTDKHFILRSCHYYQSSVIYDSFNSIKYGIYLNNVSNAQLINNSVHGLHFGIYMRNSNNILLKNNNIYSNFFGVGLTNSNNSRIFDNTLFNNGRAIELAISSFNQLRNNSGISNYYGIVLNYYSSYNNITRNNFTDCVYAFYQASSCVGNLLENNILEDITISFHSMWLIPTLVGIGLIALLIYKKQPKKNVTD